MGNPGYGPFGDEYGLWQAPGTGLSIEYSSVVTDEVRARTLEGYHALARGGIEHGGLLFGRREGRLLRIVAAQPFDSEHAHGPSFVLSEADEESLKASLAQTQFDPALEGLEPAGWYVSHSRSGLRLSERDIDLHNRLFPEWWQVILVAVPTEAGSVSATFFARGRNGVLGREPAGGEFEMKPPGLARRRPSRSDNAAPAPSAGPVSREVVEPDAALPAPVVAAPPASEPAASPRAAVESPPAPPPGPAVVARREPTPFGARTGRGIFEDDEEQPESRRSWRWLWWIPVALALFVAGAIVGVTSADRLPLGIAQAHAPSASAPAPSLGLRLREQDGRLQVTWNPKSVAGATRGVLEIEDQGTDAPKKTSMNLGADAVRSGAATYARQGGRVDFHLTVWSESGAPVSEYASFVGPLPGRAAPQDAAAGEQAGRDRNQTLQERDQAREEVAKLRRTTQVQATRISQLEDAITVLRRRAATEESLRLRGK